MATAKKLLIVEAAALAWDLVRGGDEFAGLTFRRADSVFPAVTCTVQASFRTASPPSAHGMVANGLYHRELRRVMFWEQSSALVSGERIWSAFRRRGGRVGMLFWQQGLGEDVDVVLSPAPIHKHHGGMIQDCYSRPAGLYGRLCELVGGPFKLRHYWGPTASAKAGDWIASATAALLGDEAAPDLCLTYLPTLDYDLQRFGPAHSRAAPAKEALRRQLVQLWAAAEPAGYEMIVFGDYAMGFVERAVLPNVALLAEGLLAVREVGGMLYPDFHTSRAFAMADHEIAHVYAADPAAAQQARAVLAGLDGVADVLDRTAQGELGIDHARSGELIAVADRGAWMAYPWWTDRRQGPDYAAHVDIHNKPGYDPCELFFGWPPMSVGRSPAKIRGSHGRVGPGREVAWGATFPLKTQPANLIELAKAVRDWVEDQA